MRYGRHIARPGSFRAAIVALVVVATAALAGQAQAATFTVGTTFDTAPGTPCTPSSGTCSLRQLVEYENGLASTPNPPDTINVPAGSYSVTNGELKINQSVDIAGAGARTAVSERPFGEPCRPAVRLSQQIDDCCPRIARR